MTTKALCVGMVVLLGTLSASLAAEQKVAPYADAGSARVRLVEAGSLGLKTPTGNIQCMIDDYGVADGSYPPFLRCDIRETTTPIPPKPRACELDWGNAFSITQDGQVGERLCVSDSVASDTWAVLPYGAVWEQQGFTCRSEQSGLTCLNSKNHGFTLSRSLQKLF